MRIFVSYARVDRYLVKQIVDLLQAANYDVWFDERIRPGDNWKKTLINEINQREVFLFMLTPESSESEWCIWELNLALEKKKFVVPILLQARTTIPPILQKFQYADFSDGPSPKVIAQLLGSLKDPLSYVHEIERVEDNIPSKILPSLLDILPSPFEWCYVPKGLVELRSAKSFLGKPNIVLEVEDFYISKYPITFRQFEVFVRNGFSDSNWWNYSKEAISWHSEHPYPEEVNYIGNELPRINISWFDCIAFCRWLCSKSDVPENSIILPTESQWQLAAEGKKKSVYPWGNIFDNQKCNFTGSNGFGGNGGG